MAFILLFILVQMFILPLSFGSRRVNGFGLIADDDQAQARNLAEQDEFDEAEASVKEEENLVKYMLVSYLN